MATKRRRTPIPDNPPIPDAPYKDGWPEVLFDYQDKQYWRLRDGKPDPKMNNMGGDSCLYALVTAADENWEVEEISEDHMYTPTLGSTSAKVTMSGGVWMDLPELDYP